MGIDEFAELAERLMRQPAAPGHENFVQSEVRRICTEHDLDPVQDRFGNFVIQLRQGAPQRLVAFSAHMDHPGFEVIRRSGPRKCLARFLGGVGDDYFRIGTPLRLMPGNVPAALGRRVGKHRVFEVKARSTLDDAPKFAVWDLADFVRRRGRIYGRACDDLIGVAAILAALIDLRRDKVRCNVIGIISRAEEIGFLGALALAGARELPREALVVSLETSRELPPVKMGKGMIIRVGDRSSIFNSDATRYLTEVATAMANRRKSFCWQRALMAGGTCEATAYQEFGYQTCAVCVALGNYHNCAPRRIAEEFVDAQDACDMACFLTEVARHINDFEDFVGRLPARLRKHLAEALRTLGEGGTTT